MKNQDAKDKKIMLKAINDSLYQLACGNEVTANDQDKLDEFNQLLQVKSKLLDNNLEQQLIALNEHLTLLSGIAPYLANNNKIATAANSVINPAAFDSIKITINAVEYNLQFCAVVFNHLTALISEELGYEV